MHVFILKQEKSVNEQEKTSHFFFLLENSLVAFLRVWNHHRGLKDTPKPIQQQKRTSLKKISFEEISHSQAQP